MRQTILSIISVVLVIFSAVLHEVAHGYVALRCGDDTAKQAGRLTLDPRAHLDPFGSVLLPLIMAMMGGPVFAFANPVPYNPNKLRHPRRDEVLVAFAGPVCNLCQAALGASLFRMLSPLWHANNEVLFWVLVVLQLYVSVNCTLAFFNLIPLPPLDGSSIISPLLSGHARDVYYQVQRYSMPILLAVLYLVPLVLHFDPLGIYLDVTAMSLADTLLGI